MSTMRRRGAEFAKGCGQIATPLVIETEGGIMKNLQKGMDNLYIPLRPNSLELSFGQWGNSRRSGEASEGNHQEQLSSKNTKKA